MAENINIEKLGAIGDGYFNSTAILKEAVEKAFLYGADIEIPAGNFVYYEPFELNRSLSGNNKRPSIIGAGSGVSRLNYKGEGTAIKLIGDVINPEGFHSFQKAKGLFITGTNKENSLGAHIKNAAFCRLEDLRITGFDLGTNLEDVEHSHVESVNIRFCKKGITGQISNQQNPCSSHPNNITMQSVHIASCKEFGAWFKGSTTLNFFGGSIENNGTDNPNGFGLLVDNPGFQGGVACNIDGVYFESNNGIADLWVRNTNWYNPPITDAVYNVKGCSFNRTRSEWFAQNNIRCTFALDWQAGLQKLNLIGSSFKHYNTYNPDTSRKYIKYDGVGRIDGVNFEQFGSLYKTTIEQ